MLGLADGRVGGVAVVLAGVEEELDPDELLGLERELEPPFEAGAVGGVGDFCGDFFGVAVTARWPALDNVDFFGGCGVGLERLISCLAYILGKLWGKSYPGYTGVGCSKIDTDFEGVKFSHCGIYQYH